MNKLIVCNSILRSNQHEPISVDDLYTSEFYEYANKHVESFKNDTYAVNCGYNNIYQDYLALKLFLEQHEVDLIDLSKADDNICFYLSDLANRMRIKTKGARLLVRMCRNKLDYAFTKLSSLGYFLYVMCIIPYTGEQIKKVKKISVIRSKAGAGKMKSFDDICKEYEYPFNKRTIYRLFPLKLRLIWVIKAYLRSFVTMREIKLTCRNVVGKWSVLAWNNFYKRRIVHAELYRQMMDEYLSHFAGCEFYTTNNLDRFSVIEDHICNKYDIKSYNIPHGIEYGFKFPKGFSSNIFYANTQYAADYLNKLYGTSKFIFDEKITSKMFKLEGSNQHEKRVVYFSEPREVDVNIKILNELIPLLESKGIKLYLKLHPGDIRGNYETLNANLIDDYVEAMCGNICIARKSTCLLEAIYNNSTSIAILTNSKDETMFNLFPSLNSEKIIKTYNTQDLFCQILKHLN